MHGNVPVRFGRGRLDSLGHRGLAAYLIGCAFDVRDIGRADWSANGFSGSVRRDHFPIPLPAVTVTLAE